jgi:hypothetical protein
MKCGWDCGEQLTASQMRTHWVAAPSLPGARSARTSPYAEAAAASTTWTDEGRNPKVKRGRRNGTSNTAQLALRLPTRGEGMRSHGREEAI